MKTTAVIAVAGLLVLAAPTGSAALTDEEMVDMILDHIRGDTDNPCVVIDQGSRPAPIGEAPDVVYYFGPGGADIYVIVYYPLGTVSAHASTQCLNSL